MDLGLKDKKSFVAASSKGIGLAIVQELLNEGAFVFMNGRDSDALEKSRFKLNQSEKLFATKGDVTDEKICKSMINIAAEKLGGLDILVTNSGGPVSGSFESIDGSQWDDAIQKCLLSHVYLINAALQYLKNSPSPSILTITSFTVKQPLPNLILSNSIRAATAGFTKSLANEYGKERIRVNSLLPGWTKTDRVKELLKARAKTNHTSVEKELGQISHQIPLGRMAESEEIGRAAVFLLSPAASYITGIMFSVDGGINQGLF